MNCDNCPEPKKSCIKAFNGLVFNNDWGVTVSISWVVIFSLTILFILASPVLICIRSNSPTPLIRLFDRLSISSVWTFWSPLLSSITYLIVPKTSSFVNEIWSSGTSSFNLLFILYLPTGSKSYLCGLKNICLIKLLAESTVTWSPGLNFLNTSTTASSSVKVVSFINVFAINLLSGPTYQ